MGNLPNSFVKNSSARNYFHEYEWGIHINDLNQGQRGDKIAYYNYPKMEFWYYTKSKIVSLITQLCLTIKECILDLPKISYSISMPVHYLSVFV